MLVGIGLLAKSFTKWGGEHSQQIVCSRQPSDGMEDMAHMSQKQPTHCCGDRTQPCLILRSLAGGSFCAQHSAKRQITLVRVRLKSLILSSCCTPPTSLTDPRRCCSVQRQRARHVPFHLPVLEGRLRPIKGIQPSFGVDRPGQHSEVSNLLMQGSLSGVCKYTAPAYDATKNMTIGDM
jgi:hypothetical protein